MSGEIEEIGEDSKSTTINSIDADIKDVYVAVGKNDLHVLQWALDHAISPSFRICLVHIFPLINYIPTPVGKLSRSQLSQEQVQVYINEENNRRKNLLEKYIRLCNDAKVPVDTMLVESNSPAKALLDLIPIVNITSLVIGNRPSRSARRARKGRDIGEYVKKNAPDFCEVKVVGQVQKPKQGFNQAQPEIARNSERNFLECICFSGKFY
ncbi:U-box domain-containing protein 35-like [Lycium barbarum]|uniref:U-box domain-containing protein 35-like n=1 Tax=Lycium barbarum TaxID=112863 RepID=UPI00293F6FD1|nr:U-box domain-containing protein 35-like [Lycium barbarum]XP_060170730.1 U-box domain-containing protein 35-like [Lycium barbarum]